jgi:hypothetical protein
LVDLVKGIPSLKIETKKHDFDGFHPPNLANVIEKGDS